MCARSLQREIHAGGERENDDPEFKMLPPFLLDGLLIRATQKIAPGAVQTSEISLDSQLITRAIIGEETADEDLLWRNVFSDAPPRDLYLVLSPKYVGTHWADQRMTLSYNDFEKRMFGFGVMSRGAFTTAHAACGAYLYDPKLGKVVRRYSVEKIVPAPAWMSKDHWADYSKEEFFRVLQLMAGLAQDLAQDTVAQITTDPNNSRRPDI